jgi:hypothetical protein
MQNVGLAGRRRGIGVRMNGVVVVVSLFVPLSGNRRPSWEGVWLVQEFGTGPCKLSLDFHVQGLYPMVCRERVPRYRRPIS